MAENFKIFISYRRKGGYDIAKLIYDRLRLDGYSVFFDIDVLENGNFDNELEKRVKKCKDFILILSPNIFERFTEKDYDAEGDWVRQEIVVALKTNKNIVPLVLDNFKYPKILPDDVKDISRKNSVPLSPKHFEASYSKMKESFLLTKPRWMIRNGRRIRNFIISVFLTLFVALLFGLYYYYLKAEYAQKEVESLKAANEQETARLVDSMKIANELIMSRVADSMRMATELEKMRMSDSIHNARRPEAITAPQTVSAPKAAAAPKTAVVPKATAASPPAKKTKPNSPAKQTGSRN
jgi:hypothetical protein